MTLAVRVARELLGYYRGIMQCDGYAAYEQFEQMNGITLFSCWAHVRRKYVDALKENRTLATQAIHYIGRLYKVESDAGEAGLTAEERKEKRISEAYPLILNLKSGCRMLILECFLKAAWVKPSNIRTRFFPDSPDT